METKEIIVKLPGEKPVCIDREEFEIITMMVKDAGGDEDAAKLQEVIREIAKQGYGVSIAARLCRMARSRLYGMTPDQRDALGK